MYWSKYGPKVLVLDSEINKTMSNIIKLNTNFAGHLIIVMS